MKQIFVGGRGGQVEGPNLPLYVPFKPSCHPILLALVFLHFFSKLQNITQCCVIFLLIYIFVPLYATSGIVKTPKSQVVVVVVSL